jgi:hypothetical protein
MPVDGEPIVGPVSQVPCLCVSVLGSAVALGVGCGLVGRTGLVDGTVEPALAGCRLDCY